MKRRSAWTVMGQLIGLVRPLAPFMILAIFLGTVGFICSTFLTILGGYAMLDVLGYRVSFSLTTLFTLAAVFAIARGFLRYGEQACNHFIAFKLLALIRDKVFRALRRLCPAKLEGRDKGDLIAVITSDIELLEVFYAHTISPAAIALCMSIIMVLFIGNFHPLLGLLAAVSYLVVGIVLPVFISKKNGTSGNRFRQHSGLLSGYVLDSLRGLGESIQYGQGQQRLKKLEEQTEDLLSIEEGMKTRTAQGTALTNTVILCFDLAMLAVTCGLYLSGNIDFAGIVIPQIALMSSFGPVIALANLGSTLQNTLAAGNRVLDILEETPQVAEVNGKAPVSFEGACCEDISFSYGAQTILSHLSLPIQKGKILGITGKSGSGKSTLLRLLMRFWDVNDGHVRISGTDVRDINTTNLREMEGFVTQETQLFHDSIANNLRIAKLGATQEEIEIACKKASVHDFIMTLPNGYDTPVGELGDTLSGGERQRLGLARAFLHDAPLMLLDEPTSNLDSLNEAVILKSLQEERGDKTILLVSHRESTMGIVDTVVSAEQGRLS